MSRAVVLLAGLLLEAFGQDPYAGAAPGLIPNQGAPPAKADRKAIEDKKTKIELEIADVEARAKADLARTELDTWQEMARTGGPPEAPPPPSSPWAHVASQSSKMGVPDLEAGAQEQGEAKRAARMSAHNLAREEEKSDDEERDEDDDEEGKDEDEHGDGAHGSSKLMAGRREGKEAVKLAVEEEEEDDAEKGKVEEGEDEEDEDGEDVDNFGSKWAKNLVREDDEDEDEDVDGDDDEEARATDEGKRADLKVDDMLGVLGEDEDTEGEDDDDDKEAPEVSMLRDTDAEDEDEEGDDEEAEDEEGEDEEGDEGEDGEDEDI